MSDFTAADHVDEREVSGPWPDCTPASMLEILRLALPDGRRLPTDMAEVDRLRAASGVGRTGGVTLDQVIVGAKSLYGLTDYTLTRDWNVIASFLEDPTVVMVVQGMMGSFPFTVQRWDTYTGPHAVAKHDVRVLCDPLAPRGKYIGEEVTLAGWHAFFSTLPGAQAFAMTITGDPMLTLPEGITSPQIVRIVKGGDLLDAPAGKRIASVPVGREYPYLGTVPGFKAVLVRTALPYPDGKERPAQLFVHADMAAIEDVQPVTTSGAKPRKVSVTIAGVEVAAGSVTY